MLVRHSPRWDERFDGLPNPCVYRNPDGTQCKVDSISSGPDAGLLHTWENPHLPVPVKGTRYLVTHREYGIDISWPHNPPKRTLGTFSGDDIVLGRDSICMMSSNQLVIIPKIDILAMTDKVPDFFDFASRDAEARCRAKIDLEDQAFPAKCKLGQLGHGDTHCASSAIGYFVWWSGQFVPDPAYGAQILPQPRRTLWWSRLRGRA